MLKDVHHQLKPGLHIVVRVAEHACEDSSKRILKPSTYRLEIFLVRDQYLRPLLLHGDQTIAEQLKKHALKPMRAILKTYIETRPICLFCEIVHPKFLNICIS